MEARRGRERRYFEILDEEFQRAESLAAAERQAPVPPAAGDAPAADDVPGTRPPV